MAVMNLMCGPKVHILHSTSLTTPQLRDLGQLLQVTGELDENATNSLKCRYCFVWLVYLSLTSLFRIKLSPTCSMLPSIFLTQCAIKNIPGPQTYFIHKLKPVLSQRSNIFFPHLIGHKLQQHRLSVLICTCTKLSLTSYTTNFLPIPPPNFFF